MKLRVGGMAFQLEGDDLAGELACPVLGDLLDELGELTRVTAALLSLFVGSAV
jgi:hypothetical protein